MKQILIIQRYAYDGNVNGDASYVNSICDHLKRCGCEPLVHTTEMRQGRSKPFFKSSYSALSKLNVRKTLRFGSTYISFSLVFWLHAIARMLNIKKTGFTISATDHLCEATWLLRIIKSKPFDHIILIYNGCELANVLDKENYQYTSIPVLFSHNKSQLHFVDNECRDISCNVSDLTKATFVGFHSDDDVIEAQRL